MEKENRGHRRGTVWVTAGVFSLMVMLFSRGSTAAPCFKTETNKSYKLKLYIGLLTESSTAVNSQRTFQESISLSPNVQDCFSLNYLILAVSGQLNISTHGWNIIEHGIEAELKKIAADSGEKPRVIIGPYYTNLAMILERLNIPYIVTDYKGYDWVDMSRVEDHTPWKTVVEIRPPAQEQNLAVVDLFTSRDYQSAVMIMPENAAANQECQDLASQMLAAGISLIPYTVQPADNRTQEMVRQVLRNAQLFRLWNIIICSPRDAKDNLIFTVLSVARLFDLTLNEKQVFVLVDPSSALTPMASAQAMYRLGLFSARCQLLAFRYVTPGQGEEEGGGAANDTDKSAGIDAAAVVAMALSNYVSNQRETTFSPERFLEEIKQVVLPYGRTGHVQFNGTGQRINYKLHLYNHGGADMYHKLAEWSPQGDSAGVRLNLTVRSQEDHTKTTQYGIFPEVVRIVVVLEEPFVMWKTDPFSDNKRYEGFTIDLINRLARELKFNYEIYVSPGNVYGSKSENGSWNGMVNEILKGEATLAAGAISITSVREEVIDFSLGVLSTGVNILIRKPEESRTIFQFLMPFSLELWMAILGSSALVGLVLFVLDYQHQSERRFTAKETIWFCIGTIMKRGTDFAPVPVSQRILTAGFTFFVLITASTYTANMAAFLTTKNLGTSVESFEMLSYDSTMACGTVRNSATMNFLRKGTTPVFQRLWNKIRHTEGLVSNATEGRLKVVSQRYAFIFDYLINSYSELKYCDTKTVASPILIQEHGIGMPAGAPFKTSINIALLRLKEEGFLQSLKKKWWDDKRTCDDVSTTRSEQQEFGLEHMAGVFIVGLLGLGAALALFLFKKVYFLVRTHLHSKKRKSTDGHSLSIAPETPREKDRLCQNNTSFVEVPPSSL